MKNDLYNNLALQLEELFPIEAKDDPVEIFKIGMISKFYKTVRAIQVLDINGYFEDAQILVRTLFEISVIIAYCEHHNMYQRYIDYSFVTRKKYLDIIVENGIVQVDESEKEAVNNGYLSFIEVYKPRNNQMNNWNGISFQATVIDVSQCYNFSLLMHMYQAIYLVANGHVHSESLSTISYLGFDEIDQEMIDFKPDAYPDENFMRVFNDVKSITEFLLCVFPILKNTDMTNG